MKTKFYTTLNLAYEEKCFKAFCCEKSKKYTYYSEWEKHIKERINSTLTTKEQLYDFMRYCEIKRDTIKSDSSMNKDINIVFFSVAFTFIFSTLLPLPDLDPTTLLQHIIVTVLPLLALLPIALIALFMMYKNSSDRIEACFYDNLVAITASCENERNVDNTKIGNKRRQNHAFHRRYLRTSHHRTL